MEEQSSNWTTRAHWEGLDFNGLTAQWDAFRSVAMRNSKGKVICPKVGVSYFYYESASAWVRGAIATRDIAPGSVFCEMPVERLITRHTIDNSSLAPLLTTFAPKRLRGSTTRHPRPTFYERLLEERTAIVVFMLREMARESSNHMPYFSMVRSHDTDAMPMLWPPSSPRWANSTSLLRRIAMRSRKVMDAQYDHTVLPALERLATPLSEGLDCLVTTTQRACPRQILKGVYSRSRFVRMSAIVTARYWVLPMYGVRRALMSPVLDMMNFGQMGIRVEFNDRRHAFVARNLGHRPILRGSELKFNYGTLCREVWFNLYGFDLHELQPCNQEQVQEAWSNQVLEPDENKYEQWVQEWQQHMQQHSHGDL